MSSTAERRRRRLFFGQLAVGGAGALIVGALLFGPLPFDRGVGIIAAAGVGSLLWLALQSLERGKFQSQPKEISDVDWARELREVRDSRRIIVSAFEIERRRIERDLHDGAQQYLVAATMKLGEASLLLEQHTSKAHCEATGVAMLLEDAHRDAEEALRTLRATVSGIHPQMLSDLGLVAAISDMVERSGLDVTLRNPHPLPDMPEEVAAVAWFFCSEALTNIAKHAPNARATLLLAADQHLHVSVMDDGPGGAWMREGGGLHGMRERVAAFGGALDLSSPEGGPTTLTARIPLLLTPSAQTGGQT